MASTEKYSRLCTDLKPGKTISIGDDIEISIYRKNGEKRLAIKLPKDMSVKFSRKEKDGITTYEKSFERT